jgi:hypothetical protein
MPTTITSAGITFNDASVLTSANIGSSQILANAVGTTQIANGSVTAAKLGTTEQKQIAKAWVNFNGTTSPGTIRSSYNVSSITKNATGDYTVNFTTPMVDANYAVAGTCIGLLNPASIGCISIKYATSLSSSSFTIMTKNDAGTNVDAEIASIAIFGN